MSTAIALIPKEQSQVEEMEITALSILEEIRTIEVNNDESFGYVKGLIDSAKENKTRINGFYAPLVESAYKAHKVLTTQRKQMIDPLEQIIREGGLKNGAYTSMMEQEQEKLEIAMQAAAKAEAENECKDYAAQLEANGEHEAAKEILEHAKHIKAPPVKVDSMLPDTAKGTRTTMAWKFRITNPKLVPDSYKIVDEKAIGALVRVQKGNCEIPGIEVYSEVKTT